jgi:hypothetical protein
MAILSTRETERTFVQGIREIRVGIAAERSPDVLAFYADVLGLTAWPAACQVPGGTGVGPLRRGLFLQMRHDPPVDPFRRRVVLRVGSLDAVADRLRAREWPYSRPRGLSPTDEWIEVCDPMGHRLELRQVQPL